VAGVALADAANAAPASAPIATSANARTLIVARMTFPSESYRATGFRRQLVEPTGAVIERQDKAR